MAGHLKRSACAILPCIGCVLLPASSAMGKAPATAGREAVRATVESIRQVVRDPDAIAGLVGSRLQASGCHVLQSGEQSCSYWDPAPDDGRAVVLSMLSVLSRQRFGDSGGMAVWDTGRGTCASPALPDFPGATRSEGLAQGGEPIGGYVPPAADWREIVYRDLNPRWGNISLTVSTRNGCLSRFWLQMSRAPK